MNQSGLRAVFNQALNIHSSLGTHKALKTSCILKSAIYNKLQFLVLKSTIFNQTVDSPLSNIPDAMLQICIYLLFINLL